MFGINNNIIICLITFINLKPSVETDCHDNNIPFVFSYEDYELFIPQLILFAI